MWKEYFALSFAASRSYMQCTCWSQWLCLEQGFHSHSKGRSGTAQIECCTRLLLCPGNMKMAWAGNQRAQEQDAQVEGKKELMLKVPQKNKAQLYGYSQVGFFLAMGNYWDWLVCLWRDGKKAIHSFSVKYINCILMYLVTRNPACDQLQHGYLQQLLTFTSGQLFFLSFLFFFFFP